MQYGEVDLCEVSRVAKGQDVAVAHQSDELHKLADRNFDSGASHSRCHSHDCWTQLY